jgi:anti-sigma regulatory factor (Ser/Thr protein kinase)
VQSIIIALWPPIPPLGRKAGRPKCFASELAFGELIANAVRHAPGPVRVLATTEGDGTAHRVLEDSGGGFTSAENEVPDVLAESGRGLSLVQAVAGDVRIDKSSRGGTRAIVTFTAARQTSATAVSGT